jgi:hypothetical protein
MLEIKTDQEQKQLVKVDGFEYFVRQPGAGESLAMSQAQRYLSKLEAKIADKTATDEEKEKHSSLVEKTLKICVTLLEPKYKDDENAQDHLDRLNPEVLFGVIEKVFNSMKEADGTSS